MDIEKSKREIASVKEKMSKNLPYVIVTVFLGSLLVINIVMVVMAQQAAEKKRALQAALRAMIDDSFERNRESLFKRAAPNFGVW
jgi:hypothetical protein